MSIYTARKDSDSRVMSGILATAALERLDKREVDDRTRRAYLDSLIWLLDMYRFDAFLAPEQKGILEQVPLSESTVFQAEESGLKRVKDALEAAHNAAYPGLSRDDVVEELKRVLLSGLNDQNLDVRSIENARRFFTTFREALGLND